MRLKLSKSWQKRLAQLPETGMGSQHVDFVLKSGAVIADVPVFNGEECEVKQPFDTEEIADVRLHQE
jgi:predicted aconitase with swiveling domain